MSLKRKLLKLGIMLLIIVSIILGSKIVYDNYFIDNEKSDSTSKINIKSISESSKKAIEAVKDNMAESEPKVAEEDNISAQQKTEDSQNNPVIEEENKSEQEPYVAPKSDSDSTNQNTQVQHSQPPQTNQPIEQPAPSCTPKKFYTTFRADFASEAECEDKYNYYHEIDPNKYLGFICSYQTDDCGDTYYMLTVFDSNGHYFGYNEI